MSPITWCRSQRPSSARSGVSVGARRRSSAAAINRLHMLSHNGCGATCSGFTSATAPFHESGCGCPSIVGSSAAGAQEQSAPSTPHRMLNPLARTSSDPAIAAISVRVCPGTQNARRPRKPNAGPTGEERARIRRSVAVTLAGCGHLYQSATIVSGSDALGAQGDPGLRWHPPPSA